jgi:FKBP-type peptidyl-prolyl cis-trans isomerase SlyD
MQVGMQLQTQKDGNVQVFVIKSIEGDKVTLDGNHPLADTDLNFDVELTDIREATEEEVQHGHVHGAGGHNH